MHFFQWTLFLSAAEGQRPNYSSYCSCCSWIFGLKYALSTSTTMLPPIILNILIYHSIYLSIYLTKSLSITLHCIYLSIHPAVFLSVNLSIDLFHSLISIYNCRRPRSQYRSCLILNVHYPEFYYMLSWYQNWKYT